MVLSKEEDICFSILKHEQFNLMDTWDFCLAGGMSVSRDLGLGCSQKSNLLTSVLLIAPKQKNFKLISQINSSEPFSIFFSLSTGWPLRCLKNPEKMVSLCLNRNMFYLWVKFRAEFDLKKLFSLLTRLRDDFDGFHVSCLRGRMTKNAFISLFYVGFKICNTYDYTSIFHFSN